MLGLITFDMFMAFHFFIGSLMETENPDEDGLTNFICYFNGFLSEFSLIAEFTYHACLSHCIMDMISTGGGSAMQNKKSISSIKYHFYALSISFACAIMAVFILKDVDISIMGVCALA